MTAAKIRFLQNNLAAADATTLSVSSAVSGFPGSNSVLQTRHLRWRTSGSFYINGGTTDLIYINDGSNKTVTLSSAVYATGTLLAAHVQTRLNLSSTNWTCTYSTSTGKFTIGRSSGTATLRLSQTADAAWEVLGYVGSSDVPTSTGLAADERRNHTSETWTVDLGMSMACTDFIMIGQSGLPFPISSNATLRLRGSDTNVSVLPWDTYDEEFEITRTDDLAAACFTGTYRYWQAEWIDKTNTAGPETELGVVYLGDAVVPVDHDLQIGFERTLVDPSERSESSAGILYHREKPKYWLYRSMAIDFLEDDDREELERIISELGRSTPFFISLDPDGVISRDLTEFTKYVVFDDDPTMAHRFYKKFGFGFTLREVIG